MVDFAVAVAEPGSGRSAHYGTVDRTYNTASVVKVGILTALLLRHQDTGTELTARERRLAAGMIRRSDNDAASALWDRIGGADGYDAANARLGLGATTGAAGGEWGLTRTTAADQLRLLRAVFGAGPSPLAPASRRCVAALMGQVVAEQAWGISAAADGAYALKNGWLPRGTARLWGVNSVGRVERGGRALLIAVLSSGHPSLEDGIRLVEEVATAAALQDHPASKAWATARLSS